MPKKKQELETPQNLKVIIDSTWEVWLHTSDEGRRTLLEAQSLFFQLCAEHQAEALPNGEEKQNMLRTAEIFKRLRPSVQAMDQLECERQIQEWEAEKKVRKAEQRFLIQEFNRMVALSEPIFVLDLPDEIIQKLIAAHFDSVGELLFGVQVSTQRVIGISREEDWDIALLHSRKFLITAVGQVGYNLIGSRLIQFGYLQRNSFLDGLNREPIQKSAQGKTDNSN